MKTTIESLRARMRQQLHRECLSAAAICIVLMTCSAFTVTGTLPALSGTTLTSSFLSGAITGLFCVAAIASIKRIVDLRRALADDQELRRLHAREHDELRAHAEREIAHTFIQIMPALAVIAIFVGACINVEVMAAVAATIVFLSVALLAVKAWYQLRMHRDMSGELD